MARTKNDTSATDRAYTIICDKILNGELRPGERLTRRDMASLTGVSIIPVIDALHKLENEGLVESSPNIGSRVVNITTELRRDRYALRMAVESQVARMLAHGILKEGIKDDLFRSAENLDQMIEKYELQPKTWEQHYNFHAKMVKLTECETLTDMYRRNHLFIILEFHKHTNWENPEPNPDIEAISHTWLLSEIFSGDPCRAELAARRHIAAIKGVPKELVDWV
ncbi:MAG: GntR family transcriptional regulator [Sphaerochaetaceae bacterium]